MDPSERPPMINEFVDQEVEVLYSIYAEELKVHDNETISIQIRMDAPDNLRHSTSTDEGEPAIPAFVLTIKFPLEYPDEVPNLDLTIDPDTPSGIFTFPEDRDKIMEGMDELMLLGDQMIWSIAMAIKEKGESIMEELVKHQEEEREEAIRIEEEKEMKKFKGTPLTKENFLAWRERFISEMEEKKEQEKKAKEEEEKAKRGNAAQALAAAEAQKKRMTGKELYISGKVGKDDDLNDVDVPME